ncbi:MAG: hypothetical protein GY908_04235 [Flavobacteriales bacterium]|mgnify:CR=1 FL=1|nr:hypothetical protein [Flavobacteriales bacterium]
MQTLEDNQTLDAKEWALTIFISSLPLIGLIMLLVWAFDSNSNIHKKNWAKGTLILWIIGFVIAFAFLFLFGGIAIMTQMFN